MFQNITHGFNNCVALRTIPRSITAGRGVTMKLAASPNESRKQLNKLIKEYNDFPDMAWGCESQQGIGREIKALLKKEPALQIYFDSRNKQR